MHLLNPETPKVFRQPTTPKFGGYNPPWIFAFMDEFFENTSPKYVLGTRENNIDNEKLIYVYCMKIKVNQLFS